MLTYSNGVPVPDKFLSTSDQANQLLASLILAGIDPKSTVSEQTTQNGDPNGYAITIPADATRRYFNIVEPGGWTFNVGELLATVTGPGHWICSSPNPNLEAKYFPIYKLDPAIQPSQPVNSTMNSTPANYVPVSTMFGTIYVPPGTTSNSTGLTVDQNQALVKLASDLPRLEALFARFGV